MAAIIPSEESVEMRRQMAADPSTSARVLMTLAKDDDIWVRSCVAKNPNTPKEIKAELALEGQIYQYVAEFTEIYGGYWDSTNEWKTFVCENFDENVVLVGNNRMYEVEEAGWYLKAKAIIDSLYDAETVDDFIRDYNDYYGGVDESTLRKIYELNESLPESYDEDEFIADVANIINPGLDIKTATIRGGSQGDWQDALYNANVVDVDMLEDWYFGLVQELRFYEMEPEDFEGVDNIEDLDMVDLISYKDAAYYADVTEHEYWEMRRNGLEESIARLFDMPEAAASLLVLD